MKESVVVSGRGQITLPAAIRKRLGIRPGGILVAEDRDGELVLRPAAVVELETYTDKEITEWDREDHVGSAERDRIIRKLNRRK